MQLIWGLWWDPETNTGYSYKKNQSFTFEPVPDVVNEGAVRPFEHATAETAQKMQEFVASLVPDLSVEIVDRATRFGGGLRPQLELSIADNKVILGAGAVAQSLLRYSNDDVYAAILMQSIVRGLAK